MKLDDSFDDEKILMDFIALMKYFCIDGGGEEL
jgi:hypothetical protein